VIGSGLVHRVALSPNVEPRRDGARADMLVLHYTGMETAEISCMRLCSADSKVSCHYLIDNDGMITQMVDEDLRAWHAGVSSWRGVEDINSCSIGIEIQNRGHTLVYDDFPAVQMQAVGALSRDICERHAIAAERVLAHSDIAPLRKIDPGEKFDWKFLAAQGVGRWVEPEPISGGGFLQAGDAGEAVTALQAMLRLYGYGIAVTGVYDPLTVAVVRAFQRHFRQALVDGVADRSTVGTLHRLLGKAST
jgi:N-acetylmuramoyl-L-alanine amidase